MELHDNPLLKPEDFLSQYRENIENLKNHPELLSFDKLCYEVFATSDAGKKLMELIDNRYLIPSLANRDSSNYQIMCIWADGFKDAFRLIKQCVLSHEQRIKAGNIR